MKLLDGQADPKAAGVGGGGFRAYMLGFRVSGLEVFRV